jgi:hypothetical protein
MVGGDDLSEVDDHACPVLNCLTLILIMALHPRMSGCLACLSKLMSLIIVMPGETPAKRFRTILRYPGRSHTIRAADEQIINNLKKVD